MPQASLILAIEPDRRQSSKIASLARNTLHAELEVVEGAQQAIALIDERVPDLILTSLLLSPKDEGILSDKLRDLDAAGAHVQTLVIPVLASSGQDSETKGGLLSRFKRARTNAATPEGCDPAVFGAQIAEYLERAAHERALRTASQIVEHVKVREVEPAPPPAAVPPERAGGADEWMRQVLLDHPLDRSPEPTHDSSYTPLHQGTDGSAPDTPATVSSSWADPFGGPTTSTASTASRESSAPYVPLATVEAYPGPAAPDLQGPEPTDLGVALLRPDVVPAALAQVFELAERPADAQPGTDRSWENARPTESDERTEDSQPLVQLEPMTFDDAPEAVTTSFAAVPETAEPPTSNSWSEMLVVEPTSFSAPAFEVRTWEATPAPAEHTTLARQETAEAAPLPSATPAAAVAVDAPPDPQRLEALSVQALGDEGWEDIVLEAPQTEALQVESHRFETSAFEAQDFAVTGFAVVDDINPIGVEPTGSVQSVDPSGAADADLRDAPSALGALAAAEPLTIELPAAPPAPEPVGSIDLGSFVSALEAAELAARESKGQFAPLAGASPAAPKDATSPLAATEPDEPKRPRQAVSIEPFILPVVPRPDPARPSARVESRSAQSPVERSAVDEFLEEVADVTEQPFATDRPLEAGPAIEIASSLGAALEHEADRALATEPMRVAQPQAVDTARALGPDTTPVSDAPCADSESARASNKEDAWRAADTVTPTTWPALETPPSSAHAAKEDVEDSSGLESLEGIRDHLELLDVLHAARHAAAATDPGDPIVEFISALQGDDATHAPMAAPPAPAISWTPISVGSKQAWPILEGTHAELAPPPPADFADEWLADPDPQPMPALAAQPTPDAQPPLDAQIEAAQRTVDQPLVELLQALRKDIHELKAAPPAEHSGAAAHASAPAVSPVVHGDRSVRRSKKGRRRQKPQEDRPSTVAVQDESGFFDPAQCGFAALIAKLDELAAANSEATRTR